MRRCRCCVYGFPSNRERWSAFFYLVDQLELISAAEESRRKWLSDNCLRPDARQATDSRILLLGSAVDTLLAVYPSRYGGEPF